MSQPFFVLTIPDQQSLAATGKHVVTANQPAIEVKPTNEIQEHNTSSGRRHGDQPSHGLLLLQRGTIGVHRGCGKRWATRQRPSTS